MWRWEDVKMRRCEDDKMFYRPSLLEEPCAQTLSGKTWRNCSIIPSHSDLGHDKVRLDRGPRHFLGAGLIRCIALPPIGSAWTGMASLSFHLIVELSQIYSDLPWQPTTVYSLIAMAAPQYARCLLLVWKGWCWIIFTRNAFAPQRNHCHEISLGYFISEPQI